MNIYWNGKSLEVKILEVPAHRIKVGDFTLYGGELMQVITVQKECPYLENIHRHFTQYTLQGRDGHIVPTRDLSNKKEVYRVR